MSILNGFWLFFFLGKNHIEFRAKNTFYWMNFLMNFLSFAFSRMIGPRIYCSFFDNQSNWIKTFKRLFEKRLCCAWHVIQRGHTSPMSRLHMQFSITITIRWQFQIPHTMKTIGIKAKKYILYTFNPICYVQFVHQLKCVRTLWWHLTGSQNRLANASQIEWELNLKSNIRGKCNWSKAAKWM